MKTILTSCAQSDAWLPERERTTTYLAAALRFLDVEEEDFCSFGFSFSSVCWASNISSLFLHETSWRCFQNADTFFRQSSHRTFASYSIFHDYM